MRIGLAQINVTVGDLAGNSQKILSFVQKAKDLQADLVVFPELAVCGYPPEDLLHKEHFVRDNIKAVNQIAKDIKGIAVIVGFVDMDKQKNLYNAAAILQQGKIKDIYHKQALPNYGVFDEKRYFKSGNQNKIFSLGKTRFAVSICEDIWVDKSPVLKQAKMGARLLINISSSPYDVDKLARRENLLKRIAKQTKRFVCYLNLVGGQDELVFDGSSFIVNPKGKIVAAGKQFEEDLIVADLPLAGDCGQNRKFLSPHWAGQLKPAERVYKALVLGTRDYIQKNGFKKVVVGLSGGIDSALVAAIAVEAIGKENVVGVTMPSRYTSEGTNTDAKKLAQNLGIKILEIPIEGIFKSYLEVLNSTALPAVPAGLAEENVQARIRGNLLMALSNKLGWLVLTTGNKSEIAVGYCTLYGDMSGGFAVIKDVPKTVVYELAQLVNKKGEVIPQATIDRAPTAELRENQKDQDSLPPYDLLDKMLVAYVEEHRSFAGLKKVCNDEEIIKKVIQMVDRSEYKRRQAAPGIKITARAFGKDWRLPITNRYREF